jgi:glycerophosphoryl diester phosphodiesterase
MPENTIPAFEYAIRAGVDVIETDMAVTKDNVIVLSHDPTLHSPICTGPRDGAPIHETLFADLKQWDCGAKQNPRFPEQQTVPGTRMPALDQLFDLASRGAFEVNIETKIFPERPQLTPPPREFAQLVLDRIRKHGLQKRVIVQSFDFRTLRAMKEIAPEIRLAALIEGNQRDFVAVAKDSGARIIAPEVRLVTPENVAAAHAAGLQVVAWTANTPAEWETLANAKVDAIISDDPAPLIAWLKSRGLR